MIKPLIKQKIVSYIFSKFPFHILAKLTQANLIITYYHMVNDEEVIHIKHLYDHKNVRQFKDDLDFLLKRYVPVSLFDIIDFLKNGCSLPQKAFLLTFDDGFREMHDIVAPILLEKRVPATFFINSAFIDNKILFYQHKASILIECIQNNISSKFTEDIRKLLRKNELVCSNIQSGILSITYKKRDLLDDIAQIMNIDFNEYLLKKQPYLSSCQIENLIKDGFTIGAHSIDHPLYSLLPLEDQLYQTIESVKQIRSRFSLNYGVFAFPHTDNKVSLEFFNKLYYSGLVDLSFGTGGLLIDSFSNNLQRISLEKPLMPAEKIIALQFGRKLFRILEGNSKIIRH